MTSLDESKRNHWEAAQARHGRGHGLKSGEGDGTSGGMDGRVTALETHMEYVRRDLDDLKVGNATILAKLNDLPTKSDLWAWKWQWTAIGLATMAIVIGGIIGGLSWIKPDPVAPAPVQVTLTAPAQPWAADPIIEPAPKQ